MYSETSCFRSGVAGVNFATGITAPLLNNTFVFPEIMAKTEVGRQGDSVRHQRQGRVLRASVCSDFHFRNA